MKSTRLIPVFLLALLPCIAAATPQKPETVIESDSLRMDGGEDLNTFIFEGKVRAKSEDLLLVCDKLTITAGRRAAQDAAVGELGAVQHILATGGVEIHQAGRIARAGQAEVEADLGLVTLSDNPKIVDKNATVEGWKIVYNSKSKTVQVLPDPSQTPDQRQRSRVILSEQAIPKLDYQQVERQDIPPLQGEQPAEQNTPTDGTNE